MNDTSKKETTSTKKGNKKKDAQSEMSFLEHLEELRWHIIRSILAVLVFMILAFIFKNVIFNNWFHFYIFFARHNKCHTMFI